MRVSLPTSPNYCSLTCVYKKDGICSDPKLNRSNGDSTCHKMVPNVIIKNNLKEVYPLAFLTKAGCLFHRAFNQYSADGTPRYIPNPNSPYNTYNLSNCMKDYTPVYTKEDVRYYIEKKGGAANV